MKKFITTLIVITMLVACLAGCTKKEAAPADDTLKGRTSFVYRGVTFNVGDKADDVIPQLGDLKKPAYKEQPCIPGAGEIEHFEYDGISVAVTQYGQICDIYISAIDNPGSDAKIVAGLGLGATADEVKKVLGEPTDDIEGVILTYADGSYSFSLSFDEETGEAFLISATDMDLEL